MNDEGDDFDMHFTRTIDQMAFVGALNDGEVKI
jgi:hypothetical protein